MPEETDKNLAETLYKRGLELVVKNKTLSLLAKLYDISIQSLSTKELAEKIAQTIQTEFDFERVGIALYDPEHDTLSSLASAGSERFKEAQSAVGNSFVAESVASAAKDPFFSKAIADRAMSYQEIQSGGHVRSILAYPLIVNDQVTGIFSLALNRVINDLADYEKQSITNFVNVIAVALDRIRLYEELKKTNKDLEIANKWKESLIHAMNHQIKGYLGVARNVFAELLTPDYGRMPEQSQPLITHGFEEMGKGVEYVQGILKSLSAQNGMLTYEMKPMDLKVLISDLVSQQKEVAEKAGLSFESTIADGNYTISGDTTRLEEAFKNLITNAILYNNPNGSIAVTLSRTDQKVLFTVKDTGVGISKDDQERLFKPGGMGKDSIKHNANASGYGLAFVEPVIKEHQGKIWYETEVGKGTTFYVELSIIQPDAGGQAIAS